MSLYTEHVLSNTWFNFRSVQQAIFSLTFIVLTVRPMPVTISSAACGNGMDWFDFRHHFTPNLETRRLDEFLDESSAPFCYKSGGPCSYPTINEYCLVQQRKMIDRSLKEHWKAQLRFHNSTIMAHEEIYTKRGPIDKSLRSRLCKKKRTTARVH